MTRAETQKEVTEAATARYFFFFFFFCEILSDAPSRLWATGRSLAIFHMINGHPLIGIIALRRAYDEISGAQIGSGLHGKLDCLDINVASRGPAVDWRLWPDKVLHDHHDQQEYKVEHR